jgi:hypothetical protein
MLCSIDVAGAGEPTVGAGFGCAAAAVVDGIAACVRPKFTRGFCTTVAAGVEVGVAAGVEAGVAAVIAANIELAGLAAAAGSCATGAVAEATGAVASGVVTRLWRHTIIKLKKIMNIGKNKIPQATISAPLWESKSINSTLINPISAC